MNFRSFTDNIIERLEEAEWLKEQTDSSFNPSSFYLSFNLIHRKINDRSLDYSDDEILKWNEFYPGFRPEYWSSQTLARLYLVLHVPDPSLEKVLDDLFTTGDIGEQESLYRILYLLPEAQRFRMRAAEGIRTNMTRVFDAITLDNPYPSHYFNEGQWNQMVLKSIFMDRPLYRIQGLDKRNNEDLRRIAHDFAHERWAAGRKVTPELWRLAGSFASGNEALLN
ncbi:MAG: EboA domain-containing protein, partial [Cyclobacteriaceae bacterium]